MLQISPEKVCYIIVKAREFDVPEDVVESNPGSNAVDEGFRSVLVAYATIRPTRSSSSSSTT